MSRLKNSGLIFICCLLAMPTCVELFDGFTSESLFASICMGALVGAAHVLLRPIIRIVAKPLGCITLGLIQPAIDVGLLYLCDRVVEGFKINSLLHALLAVTLINIVCFIIAIFERK